MLLNKAVKAIYLYPEIFILILSNKIKCKIVLDARMIHSSLNRFHFCFARILISSTER